MTPHRSPACTASAVVAGAVVAGLTVPAAAANWSLEGSISQFLEADTNPGASSDNDGAIYGSRTRIGLTLGAATQRTVWTLDTGVDLPAFAGPGADDEINAPFPTVTGAVRHLGPRYEAGLNVTYQRESTEFLDLTVPLFLDDDGNFDPDLGPIDQSDLLIEETAIRTRLSFGANASVQLSPLTTVSTNFFGSISRYSENVGSLEDSSNAGASVSLSRLIDPVSSGGFTVTAQRFTSDNEEQTETLTFSASADYERRFGPDISTSTSVGVTYTSIDELDVGEPDMSDDSVFSFSGSFTANYTPSDDTTFSIFAQQAVRPDSDGTPINTATFGARLSTDLTRRASLDVRASQGVTFGGLETAGKSDDPTYAFNLSPTFRYALTERWSASVTYGFLFRSEDDGTGISNRVFFGVTRDFFLLR